MCGPESQRSASWPIIALLLGSIAAFFPKVAAFAGTLFHFDLIGLTAPNRSFFFGEVAHGHFPFWCPGVCGGFPGFAEGQLGPLYPPNYLIFTHLPPWIAMNLTVLLHLAAAILGAYFLLQQTHRAVSAAIGAVTYAFSSYLVFHLVHLMLFESACLLPWLFFFVDRFLTKGRISDVLAASLILAAMFATGHQQGPILALAGLGVYLATIAMEAWFGKRRGPAAATAAAIFAMVLLALAMVAAIIHSMVELLGQSIRQEAMGAAFSFSQSLTPDLLIRLVSPAHHGRAMNDTWWLINNNEKEVAAYLGLGALILAPAAFAGNLGRRGRAHLAVVAFGLLYMMGAAGPFQGWLERLPPFDRLRIPPRFMQVVYLSLAFLIASGVDRILEADERTRRKILRLSGGGALVWFAAAWGGAAAVYGAPVFARAFHAVAVATALDRVRAVVSRDLCWRSALALALVLAVFAATRPQWRSPKVKRAVCLALGLLLFGDLAAAGMNENPVADRAIFGPFATVDFLNDHLDGFRIYSEVNHLPYSHGGWAEGVSSYHYGIEGLPHSTPLLFGIDTAVCKTPLRFARNEQVAPSLNVTWLRRMSVKYLLAEEGSGLPVVLDTGRVKVQEIPAPAPLFSLARQVVAVGDPAEALAALSKPVADVTAVAYVERITDPPPAAAVDAAGGRLDLEEAGTDSYRLRAAAERPAFLVMRQNYYPGWTAQVDGRAVPIYRADYLYQGISLPAGAHEIVFRYRPTKFIVEIIFGAGLFLLTLGLALFGKPFRRETGLAILRPPADEARGRRALLVIALVFAASLAIAVVRHPELWDPAKMRFPW